MDLSGIKDLDYKILNNLNDKDLINVCQVNTKASQLCVDQLFWMNRILTKFPYINIELLQKYKSVRTWSEYYTFDLIKKHDIFESVKNGRKDRVLIFLNRGGDVNTKNQFGQVVLVKAAQNNNSDMVRFLLDNGADADIRGIGAQSPLIVAVQGNNLEIVKMLIQKGADVNQTPITILFSLWGRENYEMTKYLLEQGANPNAVNSTGQTALAYAQIYDMTDISELLRKYGAR